MAKHGLKIRCCLCQERHKVRHRLLQRDAHRALEVVPLPRRRLRQPLQQHLDGSWSAPLLKVHAIELRSHRFTGEQAHSLLDAVDGLFDLWRQRPDKSTRDSVTNLGVRCLGAHVQRSASGLGAAVASADLHGAEVPGARREGQRGVAVRVPVLRDGPVPQQPVQGFHLARGGGKIPDSRILVRRRPVQRTVH